MFWKAVLSLFSMTKMRPVEFVVSQLWKHQLEELTFVRGVIVVATVMGYRGRDTNTINFKGRGKLPRKLNV